VGNSAEIGRSSLGFVESSRKSYWSGNEEAPARFRKA